MCDADRLRSHELTNDAARFHNDCAISEDSRDDIGCSLQVETETEITAQEKMVSQLLHLPRTKSTPETEVQEIVVIRRGFRDSGSQASLLFTVAAGLDWRRLDKLPKVVLLVNSVAEEKEENCVRDLRWIKIVCPIAGHTGKLLEAGYESVGDRIVRR